MTEIIHLLEDSPFASKAIRLFEEVCPGRNLFLINDHGSPAVASRYAGLAGTIVGHGDDDYGRAARQLSKSKLVIAHNLLSPYKIELIRQLHRGPRIHWMTWGGDLYCAPRLRYTIYEPITERFLTARLTLKGQLVRWIARKSPTSARVIDRFGIGGNGNLYRAICKAIPRIDTVSAVVDSEAVLIAEHFSRRIRYLPFLYGSLEDYISTAESTAFEAATNEDSILVGNSAYPSNNHLDAFASLADWNACAQYRILVPLVYGDAEYARHVIQQGQYYFGRRLEAITTRLPLDAYLARIARCRLAVMNHVRQQALGNLIALLYMGKSVFMNPRSPVLQTFVEWGLDVFLQGRDDFSRQPDQQRNRDVLDERLRRSESLYKVAAIVQSI